MAEEVRAGLLATPRSIPSKYFYDDRGSQLFEAITRLPEYYLTRTEESLLEAHAGALIARLRPCEIVELGSGAGRKIRLLLEAQRRAGGLGRLVLFDINPGVLEASTARLASDFPGLAIERVVGDFTSDLERLGPGGSRLMLFLASTIGNIHPDEVPDFLARAADQLAIGDHFLIGVDQVKDVARLEAAYDDSQGVTAEFNRNVLRALNVPLRGDFDPEGFDHVAFYDAGNAWIEMRLRSKWNQRVRLPGAGIELRLARGEEIRTEISAKYTRASFMARMAGSGLSLEAWITDAERLFALALLRRDA